MHEEGYTDEAMSGRARTGTDACQGRPEQLDLLELCEMACDEMMTYGRVRESTHEEITRVRDKIAIHIRSFAAHKGEEEWRTTELYEWVNDRYPCDTDSPRRVLSDMSDELPYVKPGRGRRRFVSVTKGAYTDGH